jgi:hypothetical protein
MAIDASQLLGSRQVAGVRVNPWGAFRKAEASATTISGGIVVPGRLGVAIGDAAGGKAGAEERRRGAQLASVTPTFGNLGFVAVSESEVVLMTTRLEGMATVIPVEVVARRPRSDVASAMLAGGWPHMTYYMFSAAPLKIAFGDGSAWQMEVSRLFRKSGKRFVRALSTTSVAS